MLALALASLVALVSAAPIVEKRVPHFDADIDSDPWSESATTYGLTYDGGYDSNSWYHKAIGGSGGSPFFNSSLSFTADPAASFSLDTTYATSIEYWSSTKNDRGDFNVYVDGSKVASGSAYADSEWDSVSYNLLTIPLDGGSHTLLIQNTGVGNTYLALDKLVWHQ